MQEISLRKEPRPESGKRTAHHETELKRDECGAAPRQHSGESDGKLIYLVKLSSKGPVPIVKLLSEDFRQPSIEAMVDSGSQSNLINISALRGDIMMDVAEEPFWRGTSGNDQNTLGTGCVNLYGIKVKFVVVPSKFPMKFPVIFVSFFCKISGAIIDYEKNSLSFNEQRLTFENVPEDTKLFEKIDLDAREAEFNFLTEVDRR